MKYRVAPQYSLHGKLEAYKIEKHSPLETDWLGQPQQNRWISVRTCLSKEIADHIAKELNGELSN
jgi:hypothetical protein